MKKLTYVDMLDVANGSAFLGSGGGGTLSSSIGMLEQQFPKDATIDLLSVDDVAASGGSTAVCSFVGSQTRGKDVTSARPVSQALNRFIELTGQDIRYLVPLELGVQSSVVPCAVVARELGLGLVDADGAGRSVMGVFLTNYALSGLPANPGVASNGDGTTVIFEAEATKDFGDALVFNQAVDGVTQAQAFGVAGVAMWAMDPAQLGASVGARGTVELARRVGELARGADPVASVISCVKAERPGAWVDVLFRGKIVSARTPRIDYSTVVVERDDGVRAAALTAGETVLAFRSDWTEPMAIGPDSVCWIAEDGTTFSNTEIPAPGTNVVMVGIQAPDFLRRQESLELFQYFYQNVGFYGDYQPIEVLQGRAQ